MNAESEIASAGIPVNPQATTSPPGYKPIPRLRGGLPFLGHALAFQRDPLSLLEKGWREHGEVFEYHLTGQDFVAFIGPQAHEAYFRAPDDQFSAREVYQFTVPIFGKGVAYDAAPEIMAEQLSFLGPLLRGGSMGNYVKLMHAELARYADKMGAEGERDLPELTNELTVNISSHCLLGREIRERLDTDFARLYHDLEAGLNTLGFFFPNLPTPAHRRRDKARRDISALMSSILAERRRTGERGEDFLQALMDGQYQDGRTLSDDEITGLLLTVLFAGQHTSAVMAAWAGIEAFQHPRYLEPVLDEIRAVYGEGQPMTMESLKQQPALERLIREAERLHPPLILLVRKVMRDFEYNGFRVPAGKLAMVSPLLAHRLPDVFEDPERYDPDRFGPPRDEHKQHVNALIGFGGGRHRCMGTQFAYVQMKALWTVLLSRFEIELLSPAPQPNYGSWVTGPRSPCQIRYRRRATVLGSGL